MPRVRRAIIAALLLTACAGAARTTPTPLPSSSTAAAATSSTTLRAAAPTATLALGQTCRLRGPLPDPVCTPGVADPRVTQANIATTICVSGYTGTVRPPTSYMRPLELELIARYGLTLTPQESEFDHLIPLELGGDPRDVRNLFPEPYEPRPGAHEKDTLENRLHAQVCAGTMTLAAAQQCIAVDWVACLAARASPTAGATTAPPAATTAPPAAGATQVVSVTSPIARNADATVRAQTSPGASCTIVVRYSSGPSTAQGLGPKTADGSGAVAWTWTIGGQTTLGTWPVTVTCGGVSAGATITVQ